MFRQSHRFARHSPLARISRALLVLACASASSTTLGRTAAALGGDATPISAPDPSIIYDNSTSLYHVFATGAGIRHFTSPDLSHWTTLPPILGTAAAPASAVAWITAQCPEICAKFPLNCGVTNSWAPDITFFNGLYHLYYSTTNWPESGDPLQYPCYPAACIGLLTSPTLDETDPTYAWTDRGIVVGSVGMNNLNGAAPGWSSDNTPNLIRGFHCIGPQVLVTAAGIYLTFGSFQHGIAQIELDPSTSGVAPGSAVTPIATRRILDNTESDAALTQNALEGGYIRQFGAHYYFFVSYDYCCKGNESTYWLIVGRSANPQGPFIDRLGRELWSTSASPGPNDPQFTGGSAVFLATNENIIGPGSMALIESGEGCSIMVHHYYDGSRGGAVTLMARPVEWDNVTEGAVTGLWPRALTPIGYAPPSTLPQEGNDAGDAECFGTLRAVAASHVRNVALPNSDPALEKVGDDWYAFSTSPGLQYSTSTELSTWDYCGRVYSADVPAWVGSDGICAGASPSMWAPDISYFGGAYHCYYTVSALGCPQAAIGQASSSALPAQPIGKGSLASACTATESWIDQGSLLQSFDSGANITPFRAIDPNVLVVTASDGTETVYLTFGSYRNGIYQVQLDPSTGAILKGATPQLIATRGFSPDPSLNLNAMEGPFLLATVDAQGQPIYFLICTFDNCCLGTSTSYYLVAGASTSPTGPFSDITGVPMLEGGATALLATTGNMIGPGSIDIALDDATGSLVAAYSYVDATCDPPSECAGFGYTLATRQLCLLNVDESNYTHSRWPRLGPALGYSPLPPASECVPGRSPDINHDGVVNGLDLAILLDAWGSAPLTASQSVSDLNLDGVVDAMDLNLLLGAWGPVTR